MPRLPRLAPVGVAQHIIQRGNNRQVCFCDENDFAAYASWLKQAADKYQVEIHAWVFMTNHVHLLATPHQKVAVSRLMQSVGRHYVQYFNNKYRRSGTLWEGRFKSCLIESEHYLLECYRYIELNPVRAKMVDHPADYYWSSYAANGLGKSIKLCKPHSTYLALNSVSVERLRIYQALFLEKLDSEFVRNVRAATNRGLVVGSEEFMNKIENTLNYSVRYNPIGRPKKQSNSH